MADTDLATIMARVRAVLEATPLLMVATAEGFSHERQPTTLVDNTYYLEDGGNVSQRPLGNYKAARIDQVRVFVALLINNAPHTRKETLESTLLSIERYVKADGPAHSYRAELAAGRKVSQRKGSAFFVGSVAFNVDYDVNEATS